MATRRSASKHWVHEGGISTPLIAHWPAGISAAKRNGLVREPGHLIDVMATCLDLGGARARPPAAIEGVSLRPSFTGESLGRQEPLYWEHDGNRAVRSGKWKLVMKHGRPWELYDIDADRIESSDLSGKEPAKTKELTAAWEAWAARVGVRPWEEIGGKKK